MENWYLLGKGGCVNVSKCALITANPYERVRANFMGLVLNTSFLYARARLIRGCFLLPARVSVDLGKGGSKSCSIVNVVNTITAMA